MSDTYEDDGESGGENAEQPSGTLEQALAHTQRLLGREPAMAAQQATEILKVMPGQPQALLLLSLAFGRMGQAKASLTALRAAAEGMPRQPEIWRMLADQLTMAGDDEGAKDAYARHLLASVNDPALLEAASALVEGQLAVAEHQLRAVLRERPTEIAAIRMLAEVGARLGRYEDAENLLARCLELAPTFTAARHNYAGVLYRQNKPLEAIEQIEPLLAAEPRNPGYRNLKAAAQSRIGDYSQAIEGYEGVLADFPQQPKTWMSYGHLLKTVGRQDDAIAAYRKSLELAPGLGEAWWSLANLKTWRFSEDDIEEMAGQLDRDDLPEDDRLHLHFALGKALEDAGYYEPSFEHYEKGNALRKAQMAYDPEVTTDQTNRAVALFTPSFFAERSGAGAPASDPIFIVGLPRAGSTLVEQILSSHSQVEGTQELPDIIAIARRLGGKKRNSDETAYPEVLAGLSPDDLKALGEEYIARTRVQRKTRRPFFIDKMPNNFGHVGLIHLILPNARIIDARRHPLACCFSGFKQHFARGQGFTYGLTDIGRYYADYVRLMAHFDEVLPGRVHRVIYEEMVADTETQVRSLLDYCGLPFEDATLRFYENARAVRTASSEQVRQPIFKDAVDHWQAYEPWLGPLKDALGPTLESYPRAPGA